MAEFEIKLSLNNTKNQQATPNIFTFLSSLQATFIEVSRIQVDPTYFHCQNEFVVLKTNWRFD